MRKVIFLCGEGKEEVSALKVRSAISFSFRWWGELGKTKDLFFKLVRRKVGCFSLWSSKNLKNERTVSFGESDRK